MEGAPLSTLVQYAYAVLATPSAGGELGDWPPFPPPSLGTLTAPFHRAAAAEGKVRLTSEAEQRWASGACRGGLNQPVHSLTMQPLRFPPAFVWGGGFRST